MNRTENTKGPGIGPTVSSKEITSFNILSVEVTTNTPQGGDHGHGGVTRFVLRNETGSSWTVAVQDGDKRTVVEDPAALTIELYGDTEAETFIEALKFAAEELERMYRTGANRDVSRAQMRPLSK